MTEAVEAKQKHFDTALAEVERQLRRVQDRGGMNKSIQWTMRVFNKSLQPF